MSRVIEFPIRPTTDVQIFKMSDESSGSCDTKSSSSRFSGKGIQSLLLYTGYDIQNCVTVSLALSLTDVPFIVLLKMYFFQAVESKPGKKLCEGLITQVLRNVVGIGCLRIMGGGTPNKTYQKLTVYFIPILSLYITIDYHKYWCSQPLYCF